jgi:hypothetical protein
VPQTTYFEEREARIAAETARLKEEIDIAHQKFQVQAADLVRQRDQLLDATAALRRMCEELTNKAQRSRDFGRDLVSLALQCETLAADAAALLQPPLAQVAALDSEIASLEMQEKKLTAKPSKALEQLTDRLSRLRLRRTIAEKQLKQEQGEG